MKIWLIVWTLVNRKGFWNISVGSYVTLFQEENYTSYKNVWWNYVMILK